MACQIEGAGELIASLDPNALGNRDIRANAFSSGPAARRRATHTEHVDSCGNVERGKPDPEAYLLAATLLGVPIAECLVFEDSPAGVASAKATGAHVAVVGDLVSVEEGMFSIVNYLPQE